MAFTPTSAIYLCNVPFDGTYTNQVYFKSESEQRQYFLGEHLALDPIFEYTVIRKSKPDKGYISSVRVEKNIDKLYKCNYLCYTNLNHSTRMFYAFITDLIYINEDTTEIVFETDVYQTWRFDVELKESFVEREHSETDNIGDNIVPEPVNYQDYEYYNLDVNVLKANKAGVYDFNTLKQWGYLIASSEPPAENTNQKGAKHSGVYQGLYFYYFTNYIDVNDFIEELEQDSIISITCIPQFNVQTGNIGEKNDDGSFTGKGFVHGTDYPSEEHLIVRDMRLMYGDEFSPKNKKMFTAPFHKLLITNNAGETAEYAIEDFETIEVDGRKYMYFMMYGDMSISPTVTLVPKNYKGIKENIDCSISLSGFPQCSFNADAYKLWLAKYTGSAGTQVAFGTAAILLGALSVAGGGALLGGVATALGGAHAIANTFNSQHQASIEPNKANVGAPKNNLLTAMGKNHFEFKIQRLKSDYAKIVDDYFTKFGYQTNRLKVPNVAVRERFTYVKTIDIDIQGGIPMEDMSRLKAMYNRGVTLWKPTATIGDYQTPNPPLK